MREPPDLRGGIWRKFYLFRVYWDPEIKARISSIQRGGGGGGGGGCPQFGYPTCCWQADHPYESKKASYRAKGSLIQRACSDQPEVPTRFFPTIRRYAQIVSITHLEAPARPVGVDPCTLPHVAFENRYRVFRFEP